MDEEEDDIPQPILEKLSIFKNVVANREKNKDLLAKPQIHPIHDNIHHLNRKIEKKHEAVLPERLNNIIAQASYNEANEKIITELINGEETNGIPENMATLKDVMPDTNTIYNKNGRNIPFKAENSLPEFKPILPEMQEIKLPDNYIASLKNKDYDEYYNDENLYDDYLQSNSMTNYLIEKVQELHDWITTDPDFEKVRNHSQVLGKKTEFSQLLKALNESLVEGNSIQIGLT